MTVGLCSYLHYQFLFNVTEDEDDFYVRKMKNNVGWALIIIVSINYVINIFVVGYDGMRDTIKAIVNFCKMVKLQRDNH